MQQAHIQAAATRNATFQLKKRPREGSDRKPKKQKTEEGVKPVNSREIKWEPEKHLEILKKNAGAVKIYDPITGKHGFFTPWSCEPLLFIFFGIPLGRPKKKGELSAGCEVLAGFSKPEHAFTCIIKTFADLFPKEKERYVDWELYKWTLAYYGRGTEKHSPPLSVLVESRAELRPFGGDKNIISQNWAHDFCFNKTKLAFPVSMMFDNGKEDCYQPEDLERIHQAASQLLKDPDFVSTIEVAKKVKKEETVSDSE
jgi:hypothetical protein